MKRILLIGMLACALFVSCKKENEGGGASGGGGYVPPKEWTVMGTVKDTDNKPLAGVVVSDGITCVQTDANGIYQLPADLSKKDKDGNDRYVFVSTPSGYTAYTSAGQAVFWEWLRNHKTKKGSDGKYRGVDFTLTKIAQADQERFTILIYADPQPRLSTAGAVENYAFHSLDICKDMYDDMKEYVSTTLTGRPVYGICLGDIVHQNTSLLSDYRNGMATTGITHYNVIGNHDQGSKDGMTDDTSCQAYESYMGPANYSFNLGGLHFLMLDNMMVQDGKKSDECATGLTDEIWQFVQSDLAFVSRDTPLMVCAHSPMCRMIEGKDRTGSHLAEMRALFSQYPRAYVWAGHTHSSFNYVDKSNPKIESHTLGRVTGALWTNEYLSENGTPRGYVVFDYDKSKGAGKEISWKFKPTFIQKAEYSGVSGTYDYTYRDWDYDASGKAILKANRGGGALTDKYQMQVFAPGTYAADDKTVYANIFLWDELWGTPMFYFNGSSSGSTMTRMTASNFPQLRYSFADWDITAKYAEKYSFLKKSWYDDDGKDPSNKMRNCASIFRYKINTTEDHGNGIVKVKDRFGVEHTASLSW